MAGCFRGRPIVFEALGALALRIEHNASNSIPGLGANPIIDIQISVASLQPLAEFEERLGALGYLHVAHPDDSFCPFCHRPSNWPHTYHVHLVEAVRAEERRTLAFRDYLRDHPAVARDYEKLKRELAVRIAVSMPTHMKVMPRQRRISLKVSLP